MQSHPVNGHLAGVGSLYLNTHITKCPQGCQAVIAFEKAADVGYPLCEGAQHDGAVGDRFVAGDPKVSLETATSLNSKCYVTHN